MLNLQVNSKNYVKTMAEDWKTVRVMDSVKKR